MAVVAPRADLFGLSRQVLQLAGVREGFMISAFEDRDLAVAWLLDSSFPSVEGMGGSGPLIAEKSSEERSSPDRTIRSRQAIASLVPA